MKEGWEVKKLKDVLKIQNGYAFNSKQFGEHKGLQLIRIRDLKDGYKTVVKYDGDYDKKYIVKKGDFLIGMDGEFECYEWKGEDSLLNQRVCRLEDFDESLLPKYLFHGINKYLKDIEDVTTYTTVKHISSRQIYNIEFPIPPLTEQKQIVALLDNAFAAIDQAQANIEKNIENAKELFENWTFQTIKNANWNKINWGEVCDFTRGPFGGSLKKSMFVESGYAVYEQKQAIHNDYDALRYFIDEEKFQEMKRFEVKPADLLMSCSGVTLGRVSEVPEDAPKGIINQALLKLTTKTDKVLNDFLVIWIRSKIFQDLIFKVAGGAAQPNVPGVKILKNIKLPCPTITEQEDFIELHDSMKEFTQNSITANIRKNESLKELKKSILQRAFSGALTKQLIMENEELIIKKEYAKNE